MTGRSLQKKLGQRPQIVYTCELLVGLDGEKKMSKSLDNYIGVTDAPVDMYGKVMSIPDTLIAPYYKLCTEIELETIDALVGTLAHGANPRDSKASLARELVRQYHGEAAALKAEESWNSTYRARCTIGLSDPSARWRGSARLWPTSSPGSASTPPAI
jgi:tyrosyl-tRNA synthetase